VWDAVTGQEKFCLKGHTYWVTSVAFSPDGKRNASGGSELDPKTKKLKGEVKVWEADAGEK
jgi:WD40 repeat protein